MRASATAIVVALAAGSAPAAEAPKPFDPVTFFTGETQGKGVLKELLGKEKRTTVESVGHVDKDGWLILEQKVAVEGDPLRQRRWRLKQVSATRYKGTLSDAKGPVEAELSGRSIRIRYTMAKGSIAVDQVLTPLPGGRAVDNKATFRKFGMRVAILNERIDKR